MIINITSTVRIRRDDERNWILERLGISKKGKSKGQMVALKSLYYPSLDIAVQKLASDYIDWIIGDNGKVYQQLCDFSHDIAVAYSHIEAALRGGRRRIPQHRKDIRS